ncbi:hypothetical protein PCE1_004563 [Barthelona sp. PCE]
MHFTHYKDSKDIDFLEASFVVNFLSEVWKLIVLCVQVSINPYFVSKLARKCIESTNIATSTPAIKDKSLIKQEKQTILYSLLQSAYYYTTLAYFSISSALVDTVLSILNFRGTAMGHFLRFFTKIFFLSLNNNLYFFLYRFKAVSIEQYSMTVNLDQNVPFYFGFSFIYTFFQNFKFAFFYKIGETPAFLQNCDFLMNFLLTSVLYPIMIMLASFVKIPTFNERFFIPLFTLPRRFAKRSLKKFTKKID